MKRNSKSLGIFKWLYPGLKVKRWVLLALLGIFMIGVGLANFLSEIYFVFKIIEILTVFVGAFLVIIGAYRIIKSFISVFLPKEKELVDIIYQRRLLERGAKIVTVGGGTGLSVLLHGLKEYTSNISAVVTVADSGGSSGRLREEFGVLPPGDIRNCLVALADTEPLMQKLFQFRFDSNSEFRGHNFGNLFITAMTKLTGDFEIAIKESSKVLAIRGQVIPATLDKISLVAEYQDGSFTEGEAEIPKKQIPIRRVFLKPEDAVPTSDAIRAINEADIIILGPGSLYTSILPNILIKEITDAIVNSSALKAYVCNVMTQKGETDNYSAFNHVEALVSHTNKDILNYIIVNTGRIPPELINKYKEEGSSPVVADSKKIKDLGFSVIEHNVISADNFVRHNPERLSRIIISLFESYKRNSLRK